MGLVADTRSYGEAQTNLDGHQERGMLLKCNTLRERLRRMEPCPSRAPLLPLALHGGPLVPKAHSLKSVVTDCGGTVACRLS